MGGTPQRLGFDQAPQMLNSSLIAPGLGQTTKGEDPLPEGLPVEARLGDNEHLLVETLGHRFPVVDELFGEPLAGPEDRKSVV